MVNGGLATVVHHIRTLAGADGAAEASDGALLEQFLARRDEAAFADLVRRHGPMVLGLCRRVLGDGHDAEDAFQATFLVLFRRARALRGQRDSLAGWLYTVAYHVALKARSAAARRRLEGQVDMPRTEAPPEQTWADLQPVLDEELNRLPDRYREPLVLCYLQGKTNEEAARLLRCPVGTVKSRLARGRDLLRGRLSRRGVTVAPALLGATLARATASVPAPLVEATVRTALVLAGGKAGAASLSVAALAEGVLKAMLAAQLRVATGLLVAVAVAVFGAVALAQQPEGPREAAPPPAAGKQAAPAQPSPQGERKAPPVAKAAKPRPPLPPVQISGQILGADGKPAAGAEVLVMTAPWRYIDHARPAFAAGYEVLAQTRADREGRFQLAAPLDRWGCPGQIAWPLQVIGRAPGHGPAWQPVMANRVKPDRNDLVLSLPAEEVLHGRLIDLQGRPAAGVKLTVLRLGARASQELPHWEFLGRWDGMEEYTARVGKPITQGERVMDFHPLAGLQFYAAPAPLPVWPGAVVTDARGEFRLHGVGRGQGVGLLAEHERFAYQLVEIEADAKRPAGPVTRPLEPARLLEGTVIAADTGKPLVGAVVQVDMGFASVTARGDHADGKGRRFVRRSWGYYDHFMLFTPPVRTDAAGRFRVQPFVGPSFAASGSTFAVTAAAPEGQPYLSIERDVAWPKGAVKKEVRLTLPRGVLVRGKVIEKTSGRPVAGARVDYWSKGLALPAGVVSPGPRNCGADGTFALVLPARPGHLLFNAAIQLNGIDPPYRAKKIHVNALADRPEQINRLLRAPLPPPDEEPHCYPCAWEALDLRPGVGPVELKVTLERKRER